MPMAGSGARMAGLAGEVPKPMLPVAGRPMFAWAMDSVRDIDADLFIAVVRRDHDERFGIGQRIRESWTRSPVEIVLVDEVPAGQLCSVLTARRLLGGDDVLIASADTLVRSHLTDDIATARSAGFRGLISVAALPGDQWSFARLDGRGLVVEVAEKKRISSLASTGLYWFASGSELLAAADDVIAAAVTVNGEYYVMPVYTALLAAGMPIGVSHAHTVIDMGNPAAFARAERMLADLPTTTPDRTR
jgi:NDP-sugar pyrophosphorylase family protein